MCVTWNTNRFKVQAIRAAQKFIFIALTPGKEFCRRTRKLKLGQNKALVLKINKSISFFLSFSLNDFEHELL